jgi:hypothetical protein
MDATIGNLNRIAPAAVRVVDFGTQQDKVAVKTALPKLVAKRRKIDPLLSSSKQRAV